MRLTFETRCTRSKEPPRGEPDKFHRWTEEDHWLHRRYVTTGGNGNESSPYPIDLQYEGCQFRERAKASISLTESLVDRVLTPHTSPGDECCALSLRTGSAKEGEFC